MNFAHLFVSYPARGYVTMEDVHDAYQCTRYIYCSKQREALFMSLGLDYRRVELYYPIVISLNNSLKAKSYVKKTEYHLPDM